MTKILDWKGNEVKAGMTIYFVQTKPMTIGKFGMIMPNGTQVWESDEDYEKRKNEDIWFLGRPYIVSESNGRFILTTEPDKEGYTYSMPFYQSLENESTIAIKGISDKQ